MKPIRRLVNELRLISPAVFIACVFYIVAAAALFLIFRDNNTLIGALAPNLFAGSIDTLVILVSYMVARSSWREHRPLRMAAYLQAESAIRILQFTWFDMIKASGLAMPPVGDDLLADKYFAAIAEHLDLDQPSGLGTSIPTSWLARASATGDTIKEAIGRITSRYAMALSPEMILKCTAFENSGLVSNLASLPTVNMTFIAKGTTMQRPFLLQYSKESVPAVRDFVAMVHDMAKDFEGERGFRAPVSFTVTDEMAQGSKSFSTLASARVE